MLDYRTPQYISIPLLIQNTELPIIRFPSRPLFVRGHQHQRKNLPISTPLRDSQNTSLTLSQTNDKVKSGHSEISNLSTFYQSYEQPQEIKGFDWQSFRQNVQELKQQQKENGIENVALRKTNSFHLNGKFNRGPKNQRACKPTISEVITPPNRQISFDEPTVEKQVTKSSELPTQKSPTQTRRKSSQVDNLTAIKMKTDYEYSYRKDNQNQNFKTNNTSFFQSVESNANNEESSILSKKRSQSMRLTTQSQMLKEMIQKAITNTKTFDDFIDSLLH